MKCIECGQEILLMAGGTFRPGKMDGGDLGIGSAPVDTKCRECRMKEYEKDRQGEKNA